MTEPPEFARIIDRFGHVARNAVGAIVATGVIQSFRLIGSPLNVFAVRHGQLLVLKLAALAAMLKVADVN